MISFQYCVKMIVLSRMPSLPPTNSIRLPRLETRTNLFTFEDSPPPRWWLVIETRTYGWRPCISHFTGMLSCYRPQGKVMFSQASVILSTIGLMPTLSLPILVGYSVNVTAWSVRILLECFLLVDMSECIREGRCTGCIRRTVWYVRTVTSPRGLSEPCR